MRRLPVSFQGPLEDRPPVSTFQDALRWLVRAYDLAERPLGKDEPLPEAGFLVCDLFWITEKTLRAKLAEYARQYWEAFPASSCAYPLLVKGNRFECGQCFHCQTKRKHKRRFSRGGR